MSRICRIALTCGEPAGIGTEVAWKAIRSLAGEPISFVLVGPKSAWEGGRSLSGGRGDEPLPLVEPPGSGDARWEWGAPTASSGRAAAAAVEDAAAMALRGEVDAVVTAPLTKSGLAAAGIAHPGHTELLGSLCGATPLMMFVSEDLKVFLATTHLPLREVAGRISREGLLETLRLAARALRDDFGVPSPRIGVCGLNPHAGEGGLLGSEDGERIAPAVADARALGIDAEGPVPADAAFPRARSGDFDALLAMYHDQGLAPFKLLHFHDGVNVTVNLPIVRTSPDHGTAFDIAGRGTARADSMTAAVRWAAAIARRRAERSAP